MTTLLVSLSPSGPVFSPSASMEDKQDTDVAMIRLITLGFFFFWIGTLMRGVQFWPTTSSAFQSIGFFKLLTCLTNNRCNNEDEC